MAEMHGRFFFSKLDMVLLLVLVVAAIAVTTAADNKYICFASLN